MKKRKPTQASAAPRRRGDRQLPEDGYKLILQNLNDAVFVVSTARRGFGRFIEVNEAACLRLGYSRKELLTMSIQDIDMPEAAIDLPSVMQRLSRDKRCVFEAGHITKDGRHIPVENSLHLFNLRGKPTLLCISRDITEAKHNREELRRSEETFRGYINQAPCGVFVVNEGGHIIVVNAAASDMTGYPADELIQMKIIDLIPSEDRPKARDHFQAVKQAGKALGEMGFLTKSGRRRIWSVNAVKLNPDMMIGFASDITELRTAETNYRMLFNEMLSGFALHEIILDADGRPCDYRFLAVNPAFERLTGLKAAAIVGKTVLDILPGTEPAWIDTYGRVALTGASITFQQHAATMGKYFHVAAFRPAPRLFACVFHDITEQIKAQRAILDYQEQLRNMSSELALAEERQRRQVATELHDGVGQLLSVSKVKIQQFKSELRNSEQLAEIADILELIGRAIQDSRALMFELSPPMLYELGLEPAIEWLSEQFRSRHGLAVEFSDDRQPKSLPEDKRVLVFQSVRELLYNIVKHAQAHNAWVRMERQDDNCHITVEDDGIGYFERPAANQKPGSGFGLFSIRERLRYIGGQFAIRPRPEGGTWIRISAPVEKQT